MRGRKENCELSDAIQNLPPELREKIYKDYVTIKLRQRAALGWDKVHEHISKLPFCRYRQQIAPMIICLEYPDCYFEGCCFPCFEREGTIHKPSLSPPLELIPLIQANPEYKNFLEVCSWDGYNWHEWFLFCRELSEKKGSVS